MGTQKEMDERNVFWCRSSTPAARYLGMSAILAAD